MTKDNLSYRVATIKDLDELQKLRIAAYKQFQRVLTSDNWDTFNSNLQNKQRLIDLFTTAKCFVSIDKNKIVGVAYIIPSGNPTEFFKAEWTYIRMVGVDPNYRGQAIAKTLTNMCIEHARQSNEKTIALHTSEFMDAARHIYESIGFKILKEITPLFGKRYWIYTLDLKSQ